MTLNSLPSSPEELDTLFTKAVQDAINGELSNDTRTDLYRVAMAVAAKEFHRIESVAGGTVSAEVLATLQHISHICDYDPAEVEDAGDEEDSGGSIEIVS